MRKILNMKTHWFFINLFLFGGVANGIEYQNNGEYKIPVLELGMYTVTNETELRIALNEGLQIGYRSIDLSAVNPNEHIIGNVLKEWISSGKVTREDLFITSKLATTDLFPNRVEDALNTTLKNLQLDYIDLYIIVFPVAMKLENGKLITQPTDLEGVWKEMEKQVAAGKTRTIGLSNFNISQIERIQKIATIQPVNLQVEVNIYFQQQEIRDFANENNITVVAYADLGVPGLKKSLPNLLKDETITAIAQKHNKTRTQTSIRFLIQSGVVTIVKNTNPQRLKEDFDVFDFTLDEEDMEKIKKLDKGKKAKIFNMKNVAPHITDHPEYPFHDNI